jgi:hypothetical protein
MELWQIIAAVYLSGTLAAMYSIWWPSYKLIRMVQPSNIVVQKPLLSSTIVFSIFLIFFPVLIITFIIPSKLERFINGFVNGVINIK